MAEESRPTATQRPIRRAFIIVEPETQKVIHQPKAEPLKPKSLAQA